MKRLYSRIYFHFIGVLIVVGAISMALSFAGWRHTMARSWTQRLARLASRMVAADSTDLARQRRTLRRLAEDLDLNVTYREGGRVFAIGPELPAPDGSPTEETLLKQPNGRGFYVAAPVRDVDGHIVGMLLAEPTHRFFGLRQLSAPLLWVALVLGIAALGVRPLARRLSRPVERLTEASRRLGAGDLGHRVELPRNRHGRRRSDELTELTRVWNEMAERVERMVSGQRELLANVSHELRSPLARMRVALELVPARDENRVRLDQLREDLEELDGLIEDVLTSARLADAGLPAHPVQTPLRPLLEGVVARAGSHPITAEADIALDDGTPGDCGEVCVDAVLLKRAVVNLVENAAKYGRSPIRVGALRHADRVEIRVSDEGAGIPLAERERVFDPFYRADKARTPGAQRGYGLGLTLARRVAEAHKGSIAISELHPGAANVGCVVTITLPV